MNLDQHYPPHSIRTYTGKVFDLENLTEEMICIEDIAHALSNTARFAGHSKIMIPVSQHCLHMYNNVPQHLKIAALLHDASEAYIGDMPKPFKSLMPDYQKLEDKIMHMVAGKYGFDYPLDPIVKKADMDMLEYEWNEIIVSNKAHIIRPDVAAGVFMEYFDRIAIDPDRSINKNRDYRSMKEAQSKGTSEQLKNH